MNLRIPENAKRPPLKAITSWRFDVSFLCALPLIVIIPFLFIEPSPILFAGFAILLLISALVIYALPKFWYRYYYYVLSADQVLIQKGAFIIERTVVPFARIQNIDTYHGPLDRKLGLINIKIHTAASPIYIKCVSIETGEQIRKEMIEKVKNVKDELVS